MRVLDKWRAEVGPDLRLRAGRGAAADGAQHGAEPRERQIPQRAIPGVEKPASVLAMGFEDFRTFAGASILLDGFFERGGNVYDTAWIYGGGRTEAVFGEWLRARGVRDEVVDHRQGGAFAADLSGRHRQAARREPGAARDGPCRRLFHAPRQPRRPGGRVRRRHGRRGRGGADPRALRRLELDARAVRRGDRLCEADGQAGADGAFQQLLAGRDERSDLGRLRRLLRRRAGASGWKSGASSTSPGRARRAASSPTWPAATSPERPELARVWYSEENFAAPRPGGGAGAGARGRARCTWRSPMCSGSRSRWSR